MKTKKKEMNLRIILFILTILFVIPFALSSANYGEGTYGSGIYGQASCGDAVCDASESCSICSADCGVCSSEGGSGGGGSSIIKKEYVEETKSLVEITPELGATTSNFNEDSAINAISLSVNEKTQNAKITVRNYNSKPSSVLVEAPGIVYKYLQIETQNLENLEKATINIQVMKNWVSENKVDNRSISLYRFDESLDKWNKLDTNLSSEDEIYYFYSTILNSFSFFAISGELETPLVPGEGLIPKEVEVSEKINKDILLWILMIILLLASILLLTIIIIKIIDENRSKIIARNQELKINHNNS